MTSKAASHVATEFVENWVIAYGIPNYFLSYNGPQCVAKFFSAVWIFLGLKQLKTSAYHPQMKGQTELYKKNIVASPRHYVA